MIETATVNSGEMEGKKVSGISNGDVAANDTPLPSKSPRPNKAASAKGTDIDDELAKIVLVGKGLMEDWRKMQETLRTDMEK